MQRTVFMYGRDAELLHTRKLVLQSAGISVETCVAPLRFELAPEAGEIDVLILCHTLNAADLRFVESLTQSSQPSVDFVVLTAGFKRKTVFANALSVDTSQGPALLISSVNFLLQQKPPTNTE